MRHVVPIGSLSNAHTAFYATAATVIPVLVLAYIVQTAAFARRIAAGLEELRAAAKALLNSGFKGDGSTELEDATRKFSEAAATHFSRGIRGYLGWLLLVIGAAPFVAEVCALVALSQDRASQAILVVTWIGLGTACVLALIPLWEALALVRPNVLPLDTIGMLRATWTFQRELRRAEKAKKEASGSSPQADPQKEASGSSPQADPQNEPGRG
jgi:hypothetical protein